MSDNKNNSLSIVDQIRELEIIRKLSDTDPVVYTMAGPWDDEPDFECFFHQTFPCVIKRSPMGNLNGYVGVPMYHPLFGVSMFTNHDGIHDISVHGGVTFTGALYESLGYWFIGFDCSHYGDFCPAFQRISDETYRNIQYVRQECRNMANQIKNNFGN